MEAAVEHFLEISQRFVSPGRTFSPLKLVQEGDPSRQEDPAPCFTLADYIRSVRFTSVAATQLVSQLLLSALESHEQQTGGSGRMMVYVSLQVARGLFRTLRKESKDCLQWYGECLLALDQIVQYLQQQQEEEKKEEKQFSSLLPLVRVGTVLCWEGETALAPQHQSPELSAGDLWELVGASAREDMCDGDWCQQGFQLAVQLMKSILGSGEILGVIGEGKHSFSAFRTALKGRTVVCPVAQRQHQQQQQGQISTVSRGVTFLGGAGSSQLPQAFLPAELASVLCGTPVCVRIVLVASWPIGAPLLLADDDDSSVPARAKGNHDDGDDAADGDGSQYWAVVCQDPIDHYHHDYVEGLQQCGGPPSARRRRLVGLWGNVGIKTMWCLSTLLGQLPHNVPQPFRGSLAEGGVAEGGEGGEEEPTNSVPYSVKHPAVKEMLAHLKQQQSELKKMGTFAFLEVDPLQGQGESFDPAMFSLITVSCCTPDREGGVSARGSSSSGAHSSPIWTVVISGATHLVISSVTHYFWQGFNHLVSVLFGCDKERTLCPGCGLVEMIWAVELRNPMIVDRCKQLDSGGHSSREGESHTALHLMRNLLADSLDSYLLAVHTKVSQNITDATAALHRAQLGLQTLYGEKASATDYRCFQDEVEYYSVLPCPPLQNLFSPGRNEASTVLVADVAMWDSWRERREGIRGVANLVRSLVLPSVVAYCPEFGVSLE